MLIHDDVVTQATPERVWELLSDPSLHELWNPKIVSTEASSLDSPGVGFRYRVTLEMSGRRTEFDAEIIEFVRPSRLVARLEERRQGDGKHFGRFVIESFVVTRRGSRTHVSHEVRIHHSGMNVFVRMLIWLIMRIGQPTGPTYMQRFAELAEEKTVPRTAS